MSEEIRHTGAQGKVFKYFAERPNKLTFVGDVEKATGLPPRVIQSAISQLRTKGNVIETNVRGQAWTYRPDAEFVTTKKPISAQPHIPNPAAAEAFNLTAARAIHGQPELERWDVGIVTRVGHDRLILREDYSGELWVAKKI